MVRTADVTWRGPITDPSGTATGARALVRGFLENGMSVRLEPKVLAGQIACRPDHLSELLALTATAGGAESAMVHCGPIPGIDPYAEGRVRVAMTALPSPMVPRGWARRLSLMDAVWVPDARHLRALTAAGIAEERLAIVPEAVELDRFLAPHDPIDIPDAHGTVFLAPFEWGWRAGWEALLDGWCRALCADDDATLVLAVWSPQELGDEEIQAEILGRLAAAGHDAARMADVVILSRQFVEDDMPALYAAADVVVAPARARGAGRVAIEALACGRPVIAPTWEGDGLVDDSVGWPVPAPLAATPGGLPREAEALRAGIWPVVDAAALAAAIREAHAGAGALVDRGRSGPRRVAHHDHRAVARLVEGLLATTLPRLADRRPQPRPALVIEGAISGPSSLAGINRELARALAHEGGVDLGVVDIGPTAGNEELGPVAPLVAELLPSYPHITVHHAHPPAFVPRSPGRSVQIAHWEYGPPPADWADLVRTRVDEVWASSSWVRDWYVRAGMDPERVVVVPLGVDPRRFHPTVEPMDLGDDAPGYRFLFVGGLVWRKGADLIASAFGDAFTAHDDITLVIKTYGTRGPYLSDGCDLLVERLRDRPGGPRVHILDHDMDDAEMPGLYAACDCLVHPYRGEAFGMTMLEAMACGLPVVMPDMGAARDFADEATALLVPAHTHTIPSLDATGQRMTEYPVVVEMDSDALGARLRWAYENRDAARAIGAAAALHVAEGWTWDHVVARIVERVEALSGTGAASWT